MILITVLAAFKFMSLKENDFKIILKELSQAHQVKSLACSNDLLASLQGKRFTCCKVMCNIPDVFAHSERSISNKEDKTSNPTH